MATGTLVPSDIVYLEIPQRIATYTAVESNRIYSDL